MANLPNDTYRPTASVDASRAILIMTADKTEDLEFFYPYYRFIEAGYRVDVATPHGGSFKAKQGLGLKETMALDEVDAEDYALLYIPGGKAPSELMENDMAVDLVQQFMADGKPIAAICHGPQVLAAANVVRGYRIAAWPEVEDEVREAGGTYVNAETVADGPFITARWPADLPSHLKQTLAILGRRAKSVRPSAAA